MDCYQVPLLEVAAPVRLLGEGPVKDHRRRRHQGGKTFSSKLPTALPSIRHGKDSDISSRWAITLPSLVLVAYQPEIISQRRRHHHHPPQQRHRQLSIYHQLVVVVAAAAIVL